MFRSCKPNAMKTIDPLGIAILSGMTIFFVFSIISHLIAFGVALILVLKQFENNQISI